MHLLTWRQVLFLSVRLQNSGPNLEPRNPLLSEVFDRKTRRAFCATSLLPLFAQSEPMSTLEYLDDRGSVRNFNLVPWVTLHGWLSSINGRPDPNVTLAHGVNRGKILEELENRKKQKDTVVDGAYKFIGMDRGHGLDWKEYENDEGYTHLEELFIYQPEDWRKQAREYLFRFRCDLSRESSNHELRQITAVIDDRSFPVIMKSPILVVLFHPSIPRTGRYEPLNFLLAYGIQDPLPSLFRDMSESDCRKLIDDLSPLNYFLEFQNHVAAYRLDLLRKMGKDAGVPRLCLIKELDFSDIVGQRLAKQLIRQSVVSHLSHFTSQKKGGMCFVRHPLSMIWAGPSGNGKTELARWLSKLMNKPSDDFFIKVDCGKLNDATEIFG